MMASKFIKSFLKLFCNFTKIFDASDTTGSITLHEVSEVPPSPGPSLTLYRFLLSTEVIWRIQDFHRGGGKPSGGGVLGDKFIKFSPKLLELRKNRSLGGWGVGGGGKHRGRPLDPPLVIIPALLFLLSWGTFSIKQFHPLCCTDLTHATTNSFYGQTCCHDNQKSDDWCHSIFSRVERTFRHKIMECHKLGLRFDTIVI